MATSHDLYSEYNKVLRSWFVAFGVGGPAMILVNEDVRSQLVNSGQLKSVVVLFLIGVAAQVGIALLNKVLNWYGYCGEESETFKETRRYRLANSVLEWFWLDIAADLAAVVVFGWAIIKVFFVFRVLVNINSHIRLPRSHHSQWMLSLFFIRQ